MRRFLRALVISIIAFYTAYLLIPTINLGGPKNIIIIVIGILIISTIIRPVFNLVLIPINFLTIGLLSLISNVALLFIFLKFLPGFNISAYEFPGFDYQGIIIPQTNFSVLETFLIVAVAITLTQRILHLIFE